MIFQTHLSFSDEIDIQSIVGLINRAFVKHFDNGLVTIGSRITVPQFESKFSNTVLVLAKEDKELSPYVGILVLSGDKNGYVELIAVDPDYRRSGIGRILLQHAENVVRARGGDYIGSDTSVKMTSSVKWHVKNGFRKYALTSYPSTDYYSFIFRKPLPTKKFSRIVDTLHFLLSSIHCLLTKKPGRVYSPESKLTLQEIQQMSTEILEKVHNFCTDQHIKYTLAYGTLIGAIRHKGFIPWDDDIDIIMPRPDYDRFLATFHEPGLGVMSSYDPESYILYSHVCDLSRTFVRTRFPFSRKCLGGVWIDIFPADAVSDSFEEFSATIPRLKELFAKQISWREVKASFKSMPTLKKKLGLALRKLTRKNGKGLQVANGEMGRIIRSIPWGATKHWSQMACMDEGEKMYQLTEDFEECVPVSFEGKHFMALKGYDRSLRKIYGDYMKLPPEEDRKPHNTFMDFYWIR